MGHDGIVEDGRILNDETIEQLCKQAVCQARAARKNARTNGAFTFLRRRVLF